MYVIVFIITILVLVVIHEFGHFIMAKKFGIKVLEFGVGLPPKLWGKMRGETEYTVNWLPFGGFVRLFGEEGGEDLLMDQSSGKKSSQKVLEEDKKRSFANQDPWKKITVVVAGVVMNFVLAWLLFYIVLAARGFSTPVPLLTDHKFIGVNQVNENMVLIGEVAPNSPAAQSGLQMGDRVTLINGAPVQSAEDLINASKTQAGNPIKLTLTNTQDNTTRVVDVTPRKDPPPGEGALGVGLRSLEVANLNYQEGWQQLLSGPIHSFNLAAFTANVLGDIIGSSFAKNDFTAVSESVSGPIGITVLVDQILKVKNPLIPYLDFVAMLSLNLAVMNVLPFPGLDGGRLLFLIIEAITKKRTPAVVEKYVHTAGFMILLGLIILITFNDIKKIFF